MDKNILDHLWLWSHPVSCYNGRWSLPGESFFSPVEAVEYMGIKNSIMVVFNNEPKPPFENYADQFSKINKVIWSVIGDAGSKRNNEERDLTPVLELKKTLPNLCGGIMDDFFCNGREGNLEKIKNFADQLHSAGLELWIVLYGHQLEVPNLKEYLELCDVVNFWTWRAEELSLLPDRFGKVRDMMPHKKIALGCYMWDFGDSKPISTENMEYQCKFALEKWREGTVSDIVMLGSPLCGMNIEAVEWTRKWIASL